MKISQGLLTIACRRALLLVSLLAIFLSTNVVSQLLQDRTENFPLSLSTPESCQKMVDTHTFRGTCCALNETSGLGCTMNVINGFCKVNGQEWTFTYNSTLKKDGAICPPGDPVYEEQMPFFERESLDETSPDEDSSSANALVVTATAFILSAVVAAVAL